MSPGLYTENPYPVDIKLLLDRGASIESRDHGRGVLISYAATSDDSENVRIILDRVASIEHKNDSDRTPLSNSVEYNFPDTSKLLLDQGAGERMFRVVA